MVSTKEITRLRDNQQAHASKSVTTTVFWLFIIEDLVYPDTERFAGRCGSNVSGWLIDLSVDFIVFRLYFTYHEI